MTRPLLILCALALLAGATWYYTPHVSDDTLAEIEELNSKVIVDFTRQPDGTVSYLYLGAAVPEQITSTEVPELRTASSYTSFNGVVKDGEDPILGLTTTFYTQPTYAQDVQGKWKVIEHATTTQEAWNHRSIPLNDRIAEFIIHTAYAVTDTIYSGAGDGMVGYEYSQTTNNCSMVTAWDTAHDAATGNTFDYTQKSAAVQTYSYLEVIIGATPDTCEMSMYRAAFPFDTSALPANATISATTLTLYATSTVFDSDNDGQDYVTIATSTTATHTAVATADYDTLGCLTTAAMPDACQVIDNSEREDISSISSGTAYTFTFNSAGIAAVKKSGETSTCSATNGITCLAAREGHDSEDSSILYQDTFSYINQVSFSTSEADGTSQDPYLTVTYTAPASAVAAANGLRIGSGGLRIGSGGLKINFQ